MSRARRYGRKCGGPWCDSLHIIAAATLRSGRRSPKIRKTQKAIAERACINMEFAIIVFIQREYIVFGAAQNRVCVLWRQRAEVVYILPSSCPNNSNNFTALLCCGVPCIRP